MTPIFTMRFWLYKSRKVNGPLWICIQIGLVPWYPRRNFLQIESNPYLSSITFTTNLISHSVSSTSFPPQYLSTKRCEDELISNSAPPALLTFLKLESPQQILTILAPQLAPPSRLDIVLVLLKLEVEIFSPSYYAAVGICSGWNGTVEPHSLPRPSPKFQTKLETRPLQTCYFQDWICGTPCLSRISRIRLTDEMWGRASFFNERVIIILELFLGPRQQCSSSPNSKSKQENVVYPQGV